MAIHPEIKPLLDLQEIDQELSRGVARKKSIPADIQTCLTRIAKHQEKLENGKQQLKQQEVIRKEIDTSIEQAEDKIVKLKTQQLSVKKNEEYQALDREIALVKEKIGELEVNGLEVLDSLERLQGEVAQLQDSVAAEVAQVKDEIKALEEKGRELDAQINRLEESLKKQHGLVAEPLITHWQRLRKSAIKLPIVVSAKGKKCGGCNMRISNELESRLLMGELLVFCDHCGRMLYSD
jgi:predicted  nucleic acid-binding Zn-ribbon protein